MAYPGNLELSSQAQERVVTAFRQVVTKLQDGQREEALIGLEFVLRLDPAFRPAVNLHKQLASGAAEIDLTEIISQLQAPTTDALNMTLVEAVEDFNQREFAGAQAKVEQVLLELPGHPEARQLLNQIREALKVENQVAQFLAQAQEALDGGDPQEAANFVMMAQALDPHHPGIEHTLQEIYAAGGGTSGPAPTPDDAGGGDDFRPPAGDDAFAVRFDAIGDEPEVPRPSAAERQHATPETGGGGLWDEPEATPPPPAEPADDDDDLFATSGDIADLFEAEPEEAVAPPPGDEEPADDQADDDGRRRIAELLEQGENALAGEDFLGAIHIWSQVYLVDPDHRRAAERIAEASRRADEVERRVEHMLFDARDALVGGDREHAGRLLEDIRRIAPHHLGAEELRRRLAEEPAPDRAGPPPLDAAPAPEMPDLEDDLFREDLPGAGAFDDLSLDLETTSGGDEAPPPPRPALRRRTLPWRPIAAAAGGLAIILVGVWLGSMLLGAPPAEDSTEVLNRLLAEAETLYQQRRAEEAVHLLQQFEPTSDLDRARVERRLAKYQAELAPPTPTPVPESLGAASELLAEGRWFAAYQQVAAGLRRHPTDPGLNELRSQILEIEPDAAPLSSALAADDHRTAVAILAELLEEHPDQPELGAALERSLYNAALDELRVYNLTGAEGLLRRLDERTPGDRDVARILEFVDQYKTRPVDMRLQIFINNLEPR